jgi:hypothetical protein
LDSLKILSGNNDSGTSSNPYSNYQPFEEEKETQKYDSPGTIPDRPLS